MVRLLPGVSDLTSRHGAQEPVSRTSWHSEKERSLGRMDQLISVKQAAVISVRPNFSDPPSYDLRRDG